MFKIMYIKTGHSFLLPEDKAKELKSKFPDEYKILEKNGKKFRDTMPTKKNIDSKSIYPLVIDE